MAIRTDRFKVKGIRPVERNIDEPVPEDLRQRLEDRVITARDLEELGVDVKTARYYHGGDSLIVVYWHGKEYVVDLDPAT